MAHFALLIVFGEGSGLVSCRVLLGATSVAGVEPAAPTDHVELPPQPSSASAARRFVAEHAGVVGEAEVLALLTSELVTNAVLHARTTVVVGVTRGSARVLVTVADGDRAGTPRRPPPDDERPSGRGVLLVEAMASEWGVFETEGGKTVWFTVPRDGSVTGGTEA